MEKIWVKANDAPKFKGRVAIYEHDTAHITPDNPTGLLDISPCSESGKGYEPRLVFATPYVNECLRQRKLVQVPEPSAAEKKALKLVEDEKISLAKAKHEIALVQDRARLEIEAAKAETIVAEAEIAKAKAEAKKAEARKAQDAAKKASAATEKAEAGS